MKEPILSFFRTPSFWEKVALLVATAILSGLVIPLVIKGTDEARARKSGVSQAQEQLYRDVSKTVLTLQTLVLDVSWFGSTEGKNSEMQKQAFSRYNERVVDLVADWRTQIARATTLTSPEIAKKLTNFLNEVFLTQDIPTVQQWTKCSIDCDWSNQHRINEGMLGKANALVVDLAKDLGLVK
jgi:lantibiotic modifying enzyme